MNVCLVNLYIYFAFLFFSVLLKCSPHRCKVKTFPRDFEQLHILFCSRKIAWKCTNTSGEFCKGIYHTRSTWNLSSIYGVRMHRAVFDTSKDSCNYGLYFCREPLTVKKLPLLLKEVTYDRKSSRERKPMNLDFQTAFRECQRQFINPVVRTHLARSSDTCDSNIIRRLQEKNL